MRAITEVDFRELSARYRGFHDADHQSVKLYPQSLDSNKMSCVIAICAKDHSADEWRNVRFHLQGIAEFKLLYDDACDYPNVRFDIAMEEFDGKIYFDFGFSIEEPTTAEDIRESDMFFVCDSIMFSEQS